MYRHLTLQAVEENEVIFRQDERADCLFIVHSGTVAMCKKDEAALASEHASFRASRRSNARIGVLRRGMSSARLDPNAPPDQTSRQGSRPVLRRGMSSARFDSDTACDPPGHQGASSSRLDPNAPPDQPSRQGSRPGLRRGMSSARLDSDAASDPLGHQGRASSSRLDPNVPPDQPSRPGRASAERLDPSAPADQLSRQGGSQARSPGGRPGIQRMVSRASLEPDGTAGDRPPSSHNRPGLRRGLSVARLDSDTSAGVRSPRISRQESIFDLAGVDYTNDDQNLGEEIATLSDGDAFGETDLMRDTQKRSMSVRCTSKKALLLRLSKESFTECFVRGA